MVFDATANRRRYRDVARSSIERFCEVYVDTPLEVCRARDPKGLYAKARNNEIKEFTGISAPYESPENPEIVLHTDKLSVAESVTRILEHLHVQDVDIAISI